MYEPKYHSMPKLLSRRHLFGLQFWPGSPGQNFSGQKTELKYFGPEMQFHTGIWCRRWIGHLFCNRTCLWCILCVSNMHIANWNWVKRKQEYLWNIIKRSALKFQDLDWRHLKDSLNDSGVSSLASSVCRTDIRSQFSGSDTSANWSYSNSHIQGCNSYYINQQQRYA